MKKITIVCSSGLGTSLMVKIQLENILKEWGIFVTVTNTDQSSVMLESPDLIIGAAQIVEAIQMPTTECIALHNLINKEHLKEQLLNSPTIKEWMKE